MEKKQKQNSAEKAKKTKQVKVKIPFGRIDFVLLDLDGTLLDKYFDDYFWEHLVPERYAEAHNVTFGRAKEELLEMYRSHEATLNWTDLDFWSGQLGLDIPALKEQIKHLIEVHPHVEEFLETLRSRGKKVYLFTNAHYKAIEIKFKKTGLAKYFDHIVASYGMGYPKEDIRFWEKAQDLTGFKKEGSLFIDDTESVLATAAQFGIKYLLLKEKPASREVKGRVRTSSPPTGKCGRFQSIKDFRELLDTLK